MPFDWYTPKSKVTEDVKVSGTTITITESGLAKLAQVDTSFSTAEYVMLGWDAQRNLLGLAPLDSAKPGSFKFGLRGRSKSSRTISAARFFEAFGLSPATGKSSASIQAQEGVAAISLGVGKAAPATGPRRRGRRPKVVTA